MWNKATIFKIPIRPRLPWSLIHSLFRACSPSAISRLIVSVVVRITIKAHSFRASAHIVQKCFKTMCPLFTHSNSAFAIIFAHCYSWIKTTSFSGSLSSIFSSESTNRFSMFKIIIGCAFFLITSATMTSTACQVCSVDNTFITTITTTQPSCHFSRTIRCSFEYEPTIQFPSSQINKVRHDRFFIA